MRVYLGIFASILLSGCMDPYQMETNTFEDAIVVEGSISNQLKRHSVKITRAYMLEETSPTIETNASVNVTDDAGNTYDFNFEDGIYLSINPFHAVAGRAYTLNISTSDGKVYKSSAESLTTTTSIESVDANVVIKNGQKGVQISVDSHDPSGNSKYYRYEFEETYKVVAPFWSEYVATVILDEDPAFSSNDIIVLSPRTYEAKTCFSTAKSVDLLITSTVNLSEDRVSNFPIRFISVTDPIIMHRYSINVIQYVQSLAAYTFYKTLKEPTSAGENILSQNQPGFFYGNMRSLSNQNEKVIGFFEVSSYSESRIFFNFEDIFPDDQLPEYFFQCQPYEFNSENFGPGPNPGRTLRGDLITGNMIYYSHLGVIYNTVRPECGDCTTFSSNVIPDFWE
ncbi:MAG: DUF4249 domain-containing protein [Flavobacterium sp.]|nr:DUF4249 domain-containing protein [Flavobacterium sp.]